MTGLGGKRARRRRWRARRPGGKRVAMTVAVLAGVGLAAVVLVNSSDELLTAADTLTDVSWGWVSVAVAAEIASYGMRGAGQAVLLRRGTIPAGSAGQGPTPAAGADGPGAATAAVMGGPAGPPGVVVLGAATWAGDAAAYCLPFGFAASGVVMFRVLRRRGIEAGIAGWMFAVASLLYIGAVAVLTIVAVQVAGGQDPVPGLQAVTGGLLGVLVGIVVIYVLARRGPLARAVATRRAARARTRASEPSRYQAGRVTVRARLAGWVRARAVELRAVRLPPAAAAAAFGLMMLSWFADIAVLGIAFAALGAAPPWAGLLLAYCAGQIAAAVPITPGGIGVVEGSLTLALVAFGGAATITLPTPTSTRPRAGAGCKQAPRERRPTVAPAPARRVRRPRHRVAHRAGGGGAERRVGGVRGPRRWRVDQQRRRLRRGAAAGPRHRPRPGHPGPDPAGQRRRHRHHHPRGRGRPTRTPTRTQTPQAPATEPRRWSPATEDVPGRLPGRLPTRSYHRGQRTSNSRALRPGRAPGATPLDRPDPDHRPAARRHHPPPMVATNLLTRRCRRKCRIPCDNDRPARP